MSKYANAGELRTPVCFKEIVYTTDDEAVAAEKEINVFGENAWIKVKWVNAHGSEIFTAMQLQLKTTATITMRYSPKVNERLIIYKKNDVQPYEIISIDNINECNRWLELKVQRRVSAK